MINFRHLRVLLVLLVLIGLNNVVFSEEGQTEESKFAPYLTLTNEAEVSTAVEGQSLTFGSFTNIVNLDMGVYITLTDMIGIYPYIGVSDFAVSMGSNGILADIYGMIYAGIGTTITPIDMLSINIGLVNTEFVGIDKVVYAGFSLYTGITLEVEAAFISLDIANYLNPLFNNTTVLLWDTITYELTFNFLNFINPKINTGLFVQGELFTSNDFANGSFTGFSYSNELFAGIITNPIESFKLYVLFAMYNYGAFDDGYKAIDGRSDALGMKIGMSFTHNWFNAEINYIPKFGVYTDGVIGGTEHCFQVNIGITL